VSRSPLILLPKSDHAVEPSVQVFVVVPVWEAVLPLGVLTVADEARSELLLAFDAVV
jgi:hypothetical protein